MVRKLDPREATESFAAVSSEASSASGHPILSMQPVHFCPSLGYHHLGAQLSPLTSSSPSDPPHLQLWHFFRAVWSTQESLWSVLYWKASSITCKEKNLYHLWNFNICIHNLIQFVWLISGSICFAEMFSSSDYCESFVSFFQFPTYFPPVSASTNIDLWLIL